MDTKRRERILILAKTYPSPSAQYTETSCVAGITENGSTRRLYPVPFRMIEENLQFKKWQWIEVLVEKNHKDHRPESHKIYIDTLVCHNFLDSRAKNGWSERRRWLNNLPVFNSLTELNQARLNDGVSIALLIPKVITGFEIVKARNSDWTDEEREKLVRQQMQGNLFSEDDAVQEVRELRKVPFDFYYHYQCDTPDGLQSFRHKVIDWEAAALYWNCHRSHGPNWETPFREQMETKLPSKDLMFLMGNQHRFQDQWLIISLIYPPKLTPTDDPQMLLF